MSGNEDGEDDYDNLNNGGCYTTGGLLSDGTINNNITKNFHFAQLKNNYKTEVHMAIKNYFDRNKKHFKAPHGKNNQQILFGWVTWADTASLL